MSVSYPYCEDINLLVEGRITAEDARRQMVTAREILHRLETQPGVVLADEVGMGKTFVALAAAASVALSDVHGRPVVVMVPPSLRGKWPTDFAVFLERCVPGHIAARLSFSSAHRAVDFLRLLDDPPERKRSVIFLTHGAFSNELCDGWVTLAFIRRALHGRHGMDELRLRLSRVLGEILNMRWVERCGQEIWIELLRSDPGGWLRVVRRWGIDPEHDGDSATDDDPVPEPVVAALRALRGADTKDVFEALQQVPLRKSKHRQARIRDARSLIREHVRALWRQCVSALDVKLPLLVLDEAHHLRNPETRLAGLFRASEAEADSEAVSRGAFAGVFERMLFLTATPFQLGHGELCSVLERFSGVSWEGPAAPPLSRDEYARRLGGLRLALDSAQEAAVSLDTAWGRLTADDLVVDGRPCADVDRWWAAVMAGGETGAAGEGVCGSYRRTAQRMAEAEAQLRPWVIRHLRPRRLPAPHECRERRRRLPGAAIVSDGEGDGEGGLQLDEASLLPFLLAARAVACTPESRPVFAEGLASSYEAFLQTRQSQGSAGLDTDDDGGGPPADLCDAARWYLEQLETQVLPAAPRRGLRHPKMAATVARALELWRAGEKVVVFCHYVATGRALRRRLCAALDDEIARRGAELIGCSPAQARSELERIGQRFFDSDSPVRRECDAVCARMVARFPALSPHTAELQQIVRRYLRTPSFLTRFMPLHGGELPADAIARALESRDASGASLEQVLAGFFHFLADTCAAADRERYIEAASRIQTGSHTAGDAAACLEGEDLQDGRLEGLLPNVRLVNGSTRNDTRQRLMLGFNTPFYPEVLIASSVLSEGVDLHLSCRYVIHHDLCWNPTTLEQRTGRVDRIGAKAERVGQPICIYLPYVAETQDEKMYRVVMDRERWFSVVMGEDYRLDPSTLERLAARLPFPEPAAQALAFRLGVEGQGACHR